MDAVITYVNGLDPLWQKDYEKRVGVSILSKRFRDWGTLKFLLRGIQKYMPFVENVYLVVARDSQVPEWVDRSQLRIVTHDMIMPAESLPTFNSSMIEMFLHRIPGLADRYLYFNDDMFPVADCSVEDFFVDGKTAMNYSKTILCGSKFKQLAKRSDHLARKALGLKPSMIYDRPQHTCSPMQRKPFEELYAKVEPEIMASLTPLRSDNNYNQYLFLDYLLYTGRAFSRRIPAKYYSLATSSPSRICRLLLNPGSKKLICINDVHLSEKKFQRYQKELLEGFNAKFPEKSRFEL